MNREHVQGPGFARPSAIVRGAERRAAPRYEYWVSVRVTHADALLVGSSTDVSAGGMRLEVEGGLPKVGDRYGLEFYLPTLREPVRVAAEVRWIDQGGGLCGVQFMSGLRAREVWAIHQLAQR